MKQIALHKVLTYFYTNSDEIESERFDEKLENLRQELGTLLKKHGIELAETHTTFYGLEKLSICNCEKCGQLMINRDKNPAGFNTPPDADIELVIIDGGEHEGKLLCMECLPIAHRWGLHS
jgi:hypothetical protein